MKTDTDFEQKLFNEEIKEWSEMISTPRYKYMVKKVKEILDKSELHDKSVLEVGCGISSYLKDIKAKEKWGMDLSQGLLDRNDAVDTKFIQGNLLSCSKVIRKKFDFIFMIGVIHHIDEREHDIVIKELKTLLKKGGKLLIVEPNMVSVTAIYYNLRKLIEKISKSVVKKIVGFYSENEKYIYPNKLKKILWKNDFTITESYTFQTLRLPPITWVTRLNIEKINERIDKLIKKNGTVLVLVSKYETN